MVIDMTVLGEFHPPVIPSDLILCDGDEDRYLATTIAGAGLRVTLIPTETNHRLRLTLTAASNEGVMLGDSYGHEGNLQVGIAASPAGGEYQIKVSGLSGSNEHYALLIEPISSLTALRMD